MTLAILLAALAPISRAQAVPVSTAVFDDLAVEISSHIARHDTDYAVFHGCVDWHSAAHGHWALFRLARVDKRFDRQALAAEADFTSEGIAAEKKLLEENPYFEMPYGRSWFLRLAVDYEDWARENDRPDTMRLRAMADEAAASLLRFYGEYPATPQAAEYANASWALAQLRAYYLHAGDNGGVAAVDRIIGARFAKDPGSSFAGDAGSPEFFSLFGNWAYLRVKSGSAPAIKLSDDDLKPVRLLPDPHHPSHEFAVASHHLGMNWSRAWALKALSSAATSQAERKRLELAYAAHVEEGLSERKRYRDDYMRYGHWIPQFTVYALTEGLTKN